MMNYNKWKRRYIVLSRDSLSYYSSETFEEKRGEDSMMMMKMMMLLCHYHLHSNDGYCVLAMLYYFSLY